MLSANHWRLAVSALAATVLSSAAASAQPLAMNDPGFFRFPGSVFQQVMREPAPQAMPEERVTEQPAGVVAERFRRQVVAYNTSEAPGTIVIDTPNTYLYYVLGGGRAIRYGIGVGREGFTWAGTQTVARKQEWPDWNPPPEMIARQPYLPRFMAGGPGNPLGARAMYLGNTVYRIHGTNAPDTIGTARVVGLHPPDQRGRRGPVQSRVDRRQGRRAADERPSSGRRRALASGPLRHRCCASACRRPPISKRRGRSPLCRITDRPALAYGSSASRLY